MVRFIAENSERAYVLYRELDYFEQLGALEKHGGFDFELIRSLLGQRLVDRWDMWQPTIEAIGGRSAYPMFDQLVAKVRGGVMRSLRADGPLRCLTASEVRSASSGVVICRPGGAPSPGALGRAGRRGATRPR